jgi:hypothetical protein
MRVSRRRRKLAAPPGRANSGAEAWTMTKPEMTKKISTPEAQGIARDAAAIQPAGSRPLVTASLATWTKATAKAATARRPWTQG